MPATNNQIRVKDFLATALASELGTYNTGITTMPALNTLPVDGYGFQYPPNEWDVQGLEVFVRLVDGVPFATQYAFNGGIFVDEFIDIILKFWDLSNNANKIINLMGNIRTANFIINNNFEMPVNEMENFKSQYVIRLVFHNYLADDSKL